MLALISDKRAQSWKSNLLCFPLQRDLSQVEIESDNARDNPIFLTGFHVAILLTVACSVGRQRPVLPSPLTKVSQWPLG
jgi:hypothetical protein